MQRETNINTSKTDSDKDVYIQGRIIMRTVGHVLPAHNLGRSQKSIKKIVQFLVGITVIELLCTVPRVHTAWKHLCFTVIIHILHSVYVSCHQKYATRIAFKHVIQS